MSVPTVINNIPHTYRDSNECAVVSIHDDSFKAFDRDLWSSRKAVLVQSFLMLQQVVHILTTGL